MRAAGRSADVARPDLTARTASQLVGLEAALRTRSRRIALTAAGLAVVVLLHALLGDARIAWLAVLFVGAAGLSGGHRFGLSAATASGAAHTLVDVVIGLGLADVLGVLARFGALLSVGLVAAVASRFEQQRDRALLRSATEDSVTGLLNVRTFYDALADLRAKNTPYAIVLADIAGMRQLNERYGHPMGTEAVRALGHVLRRNTKNGDLVARLGSDEVAIALIGADEPGAVQAAKRLAARLGEEVITLPDGRRFQVHAYFGVACFPTHAQDEVALLRQADHAVADAKERGPDEVGLPGDGAV